MGRILTGATPQPARGGSASSRHPAHPPYNTAYACQHWALGTDVERRLVADNGNKVLADAVAPDGTAYAAFDAKYTTGARHSLYEGRGPEFIQDRLLKDFDDELRAYGDVISSAGNPVERLAVVASTREAQALAS